MDSLQVLAGHPIDLYRKLEATFPDSEAPWLGWEPETVLASLPEVTDDLAKDKILAIQALASNSSLGCSVAIAFEKVVHGFCNNPCIMDAAQPPGVEEIYYAVTQIRALVQEVHGKPAVFSGQVPGYVAAAGHYHGWFLFPEELSFASEFLEHLSGVVPGSRRYTDYADLFTQGKDLLKALENTSLSLGDLKAMDNLPEDSPAANLLRRVLRCLLYDPTLPYQEGIS
ncbi:MAG: hypothetical protein LHW56_01755 [Candidatus Cloacimonetes bacterium]|nr:hypothetical protein [Candidatus Cloacimonadota bacterium]MDY0171613.1 hypothetical protein [Candidatus Cloacimonadaceae bacterium]